MSDQVDVNPDVPDAPVKGDFADHALHGELAAHIEQFGGFAVARLHQLLDEMRALFNA